MISKRTAFFRILFLMMVAIGIFAALIGRLYHLQIIRASDLKDSNRLARTYVKPLPPERGYIVDRNQQPLALNKTVYTIKIDKAFVPEDEDGNKDIRGTLMQVREALGLTNAEIESHVRALKVKQARVLKREISEEEKKRIMSLGVEGIFSDPASWRVYPEGTLASHILGYTGTGNKGLAGLEYTLNEKLRGQRLVIHGEKDKGQRHIADKDYSEYSTRGMDAVLTIDSYIQFIVEREIERTRNETNALQVNAVVMHPKSGEIVAMANSPSFDSNHYGDYAESVRKNTLLSDMFEPGSVIKPFTVIAALDQDRVTPDTVFDCSSGYFYGRSIRDDIHRFENLTVHDILVRSSNIGTVKIARTLGRDETKWKEHAHYLRDYFRRFGFKHHTDRNVSSTCELPGELVGTLKPLQQWLPSSVASVPYGQEMSTNTLILTAAYSAIANRGVYVKPTIIKGFLGDEEYFYPSHKQEPKRIVDSEPVEQVVSMLVDVVEDPEGTGHQHVRLPGYHVAGKTGTAQKVNPETGTYGKGMRISSFAGFFPAYDPEVVIVVVVNEPKNGKYGGETAGPAWKKIAEEIIAYWGIPPTYKHDPLLLAQQEEQADNGKEDDQSKEEAKSFGVTQILPIPNHKSIQKVHNQMPNLMGMTKRDAFAALAINGLKAQFKGSGKVVSQEMEAGSLLQGRKYVGGVTCEPMLTDPTVPWSSPQVVQR